MPWPLRLFWKQRWHTIPGDNRTFRMVFRFWRRIRIAPGVTLNLSKSGGSLSFGPHGAKFTIGPRGKRTTVGIPGTSLFYTTRLPDGESSRGRRHAPSPAAAAPPARAEDRLTRVSSSGSSRRTTRRPWWMCAWSWCLATKRRPSNTSRRPSTWPTARTSPVSWRSKRSGWRKLRTTWRRPPRNTAVWAATSPSTVSPPS